MILFCGSVFLCLPHDTPGSFQQLCSLTFAAWVSAGHESHIGVWLPLRLGAHLTQPDCWLVGSRSLHPAMGTFLNYTLSWGCLSSNKELLTSCKHLGTSLQRHTWLVMGKQIVLQGRWLRRHWIFKRAKDNWDSGLHGQRIRDSKSCHWVGPMMLPTLLQPGKMLRLISRSYNIDHTCHLSPLWPCYYPEPCGTQCLNHASKHCHDHSTSQIPSPLGFWYRTLALN